ncbi:recombinase family protein [Nocardioides sp. 1609]|uniref:recombinase family protein n=1 Tax=Nocardioides sp. 1609 TaxID=2508327 RepID=UPI00106FEC3B|nr:recombinase family protein [Nocardioides sp. 1609]
MARRKKSKQPSQLRLVAYARVSRAREAMESPEIQLRSVREWCAQHGHTIVTEIVDPDATGRNFNRKVQAGIGMVEDGRADGIVVYKFSRFGRHNAGVQLNLGRILGAGGELYSSTEVVDATTAAGAFSRDMLIAVASFESNRFSEQWSDSQEYRIARGLPHTGDPRFGYVHHKCRSQPITAAGWLLKNEKDPDCHPGGDCREEYRIDPVTGPVLAEMYRQYVDGSSLASIASRLIALGVPTTRNGQWRSSLVGDLMDSGFAAGFLRVGGRGLPSEANDTELVAGAQDRLISEEEWSAYKARRARMRGNASSVRYRWPLSGITRCGLCGGPMTCTTGSPGGKKLVRGYIMRCVTAQDNRACRGVWRVTADVETALFDRLDVLASLLEEAGRAASRVAPAVRSEQENQRRRIEKKLAKVRADRGRLVDLATSGALPIIEVAAKRIRLDAEIVALEDAATVAGAPAKAWTAPQVRTLRKDWPTLGMDVRREMIRTLVESITVHRDKSILVRLVEPLEGVASYS